MSSNLLETAFEALVQSYLHTARQRAMGERRQVGRLPAVRYHSMDQMTAGEPETFFVWRVPPEVALAHVRAAAPQRDCQVVVVGDDGDNAPSMAHYRDAGCRRLERRWLMSRPLTDPPPERSRHVVYRATRPGEALLLNLMDGADGVMVDDLRDPDMRFYYVLHREEIVGQARAGWLDGGVQWVSGVYTAPSHRRRGVARALMTRLLTDGTLAAGGESAARSMLLATEVARSLYEALGYQMLARVEIYRCHAPS
ncbi:MAG: GNAT family N-acetyltransferase [Candidatus Promineifilaceae bacterium]|nr:GNAT family N-acetyltransferase [Candidatus Promineifilaceae bacterium]